MPAHKGSAHWEGDLQTGKGTVSTETGVLKDQPYNFKARFEDGAETTPEELIAAAHASCFSMALSMILGEHGLTADSIDTKASAKLQQVEGGFAITTIHLDVTASIPGADAETFATAANAAKEGCPISKVLAGAEITMDARLA
ncbi:OsmC family protein [Palleronia caenipelagi]|uniref:OsmC family protein n=1 Tax=Palleronia caenipelagi TaxID=2489174 RepID=A0A547Q9S0_9RHOB|nr:OsmC family protein [Palleronia caenipelagi]TRD23102.1 OsmC family protein [Palleronia caenipelagi]